MDEAAIKTFLHDQVDAWNASDHARFFALYRGVCGGALQIE